VCSSDLSVRGTKAASRIAAIGAGARLSIELIRGEKLEPTPIAKKLNEYVLGLDSWIDRMTSDPYNFMRITLEHEDLAVRPLDRMGLKLRVQNVSRRPIAIGPNSPIQSRVLLAPAVTINGVETHNLLSEVVRLDRRLRLKPQESLTIPVWAGRGWIGTLNDLAVESAFTIRWRAIQGFVATEAGGFKLGPLSVTTQTERLNRFAMPFDGSIGDLAEAIDNAEGVEVMQRVLQISSKIVSFPRDMPAEQRGQIFLMLGNSLLNKIATMNELERAYTIVSMYRAGALFVHPELKQRLMEIVGDDRSQYVRLAMLLTFITDDDDAYLRAIETDDDPELAELASLRRAMLARAAAQQ